MLSAVRRPRAAMLALALALPAAAPAPALAQEPDVEQAKSCLVAYRVGVLMQSGQLTEDYWAPGGAPKEDFSARLYHAAAAAKPEGVEETRADVTQRSMALTEQAVGAMSDQMKETTMRAQVGNLRDQALACDAIFGVGPEALSSDISDEECAVRYSALALSISSPAEYEYLIQRARVALSVDALAEGATAFDEDFLARVQQGARDRSQQYFTPDGQPDFAALQDGFVRVRACDAKYALSLTPLPAQVAPGG